MMMVPTVGPLLRTLEKICVDPVARNGIFSLKWRHYGPKRDILVYWGILIFWFIILLYPIKG